MKALIAFSLLLSVIFAQSAYFLPLAIAEDEPSDRRRFLIDVKVYSAQDVRLIGQQLPNQQVLKIRASAVPVVKRYHVSCEGERPTWRGKPAAVRQLRYSMGNATWVEIPISDSESGAIATEGLIMRQQNYTDMKGPDLFACAGIEAEEIAQLI